MKLLLDANNGYFLAEGGAVYRTANAGKTWTQLLGVGTDTAYGMAFSSKTKGYLVINRFGGVGGAFAIYQFGSAALTSVATPQGHYVPPPARSGAPRSRPATARG